MGAIFLDPRMNQQLSIGMKDHHQHGIVIDEIQGLIKVYKDGQVERPPIMPNVAPTVVAQELIDLSCKDVVVDKFNNIWARFYVPRSSSHGNNNKLPLLIYFHGGGFCVGSAAWICYHEFLAKLASTAGCVIMSVNYRLAPENRLPAAYDDGVNALMWVKQQALNGSNNDQKCWLNRCNLSKVFIAGDSAGANIAHNVAKRAGSGSMGLNPLTLKGIILIQPFFGGEERTNSEKVLVQPPKSALSLKVSDEYWRLSLPVGANRDHKWCNPLAKTATKLEGLKIPPIMVCISEMDILKDRNLEFCSAMRRAGKNVEQVMYMGVGHAFQILHNYQLSQTRTHEMMSHIKGFINR
ncbi:Alpha/beta hydrolase fold-3 [Macleaya cordata]|uniref:Alpha/beta hydrolase fold-3 n=1 Tax=Macleaya cordata TaxID=56857 RepID=A0A200Q3H1_MACCD|nr:Alpha/beta hydrolase fold-3 [Macleaya cordata]